MTNLDRLQQQLRTIECDGLLVPSTDEYLSEFVRPSNQRLRWVTGFSGSTGLAIVLCEQAALFLDGRYKSQGKLETALLRIEVLDNVETVRHSWLAKNLAAGQRLALDTRLQAHPEIERTRAFAAEHGIEVVELVQNPIDELWLERPPMSVSAVHDYPTHFAGASSADKCRQLGQRMTESGLDCHLIADPEDVAWLLNVRTQDSRITTPDGWHTVPIPLSRALLEANGDVSWFVAESRLEPALKARIEGVVKVVDPARFESFLRQRAAGKVVGANLRRTSGRFAAIVADVGALKDDPSVAHQRWRKHPDEIARAREGHYQDGQAVIRFLAWLDRVVLERTVSELAAAQKLTTLRAELPGYKGPSMPLMSASGPNGAMAHYVPSERSNRNLNDHPIYWMDSGGQYYGCSTDNTVCIAVGKPDARHILAHTLIVKGLIALTVAQFPAGIYSSQLDSFARQHLWRAGMDYSHGTGHGVGNFMNIHEGPSIRKEIGSPLVVPMEAGMIVSNEPAYYAPGEFGIRVESHMVSVVAEHPGFLKFETLSRLPIDPRLLDKELLTAEERRWLVDYHIEIFHGYEGCFDANTTRWLEQVVTKYTAMAGSAHGWNR